jgi:hypothetical protein
MEHMGYVSPNSSVHGGTTNTFMANAKSTIHVNDFS